MFTTATKCDDTPDANSIIFKAFFSCRRHHIHLDVMAIVWKKNGLRVLVLKCFGPVLIKIIDINFINNQRKKDTSFESNLTQLHVETYFIRHV
jgi:hypothetical protein